MVPEARGKTISYWLKQSFRDNICTCLVKSILVLSQRLNKLFQETDLFENNMQYFTLSELVLIYYCNNIKCSDKAQNIRFGDQTSITHTSTLVYSYRFVVCRHFI